MYHNIFILYIILFVLVIIVISFILDVYYTNKVFDTKRIYDINDNTIDIDMSEFVNDNILINDINEFKGIYSNIPDTLIFDEINFCRASVYLNLMNWKNNNNDYQNQTFMKLDLKIQNGSDIGYLFVVIGKPKNESDELIKELEVSLISAEELVPTSLVSCFKVGTISHSDLNRWVCTFSYYNDLHEGLYNVSIRGEVCNDINEVDRLWSMASLGVRQGLRYEILTHYLYQINVSTYILHNVQNYSNKPSCNFSHEALMSQYGNPRWRKMLSSEDNLIKKYWFNDTLYNLWENNICNYRDIRPKEFVMNLKMKNISSVILIGDSLTRHMFNEFEDYFRNVTSEWLEKHPLVYTDRETMGEWSNWDGIKGGWLSRDNFLCALPYITGLCYENGNLKKKCETDGPLFTYKEFFAMKPDGSGDYSTQDWTNLIEKDFFSDVKENSIIVMNIGLWLLAPGRYTTYRYTTDNIKVVTAFADLCEKYKVIFVWRSTLYNHVRSYNREVRKLNRHAIKILKSRVKNMFYLDSAYSMSSLRPDRTSDGFHYGYRKRTSVWRYCDTDEEIYRGPVLNCIREPYFPASVSRQITLTLINYLANTKFSSF